MAQIRHLKDILERLYKKYNRPELIKPDPLQFVHAYSLHNDREIAGLVASCLAYGRIEQIEASLNRLFGMMGSSPCGFTLGFGTAERRRLGCFKHRFTSGDDISALIELLKKIYRQNATLEQFFAAGYSKTDRTVIPAMTTFRREMLLMHRRDFGGRRCSGLQYLLPDPAKNSPCKRLNMFLRWMVRRDRVDCGLWRSIEKTALIMPMDVHISRITHLLGLHNKKNISLKTAVEVTEAFADICPQDPVKYDFALCRTGIENNRRGDDKALQDDLLGSIKVPVWQYR